MSTLFHSHGDADDDTADLGQPIPHEPDEPDDLGSSFDSPDDRDGGRLRPTRRARRLRTSLWLATYTTTCLGSAWLLGLAFLHANALLLLLLLTGALGWFGPTTVRLARRLGAPTILPPLRLPRTQRLAAALLAPLYAYLAVDWLAWTLRH